MINMPSPSEVPLLPKLSCITWTLRSEHGDLHIRSVLSRAALAGNGRPAPGDTKESLTRLLKRAATEVPWPELPAYTAHMFGTYFWALTIIGKFGEPEAAVEILNRHVEDVEKYVGAPNLVATYLISRLDWLLSAAVKFESDEGKRGAYVAEAKGLMDRATRSLRGLRRQDWDHLVSSSATTSELTVRG
jgi:hypothetical protein